MMAIIDDGQDKSMAVSVAGDSSGSMYATLVGKFVTVAKDGLLSNIVDAVIEVDVLFDSGKHIGIGVDRGNRWTTFSTNCRAASSRAAHVDGRVGRLSIGPAVRQRTALLIPNMYEPTVAMSKSQPTASRTAWRDRTQPMGDFLRPV
jgi:hypothetical protein